MTMMIVMQNLTIKQLVTDWFTVHRAELPGSSDVDLSDENKIINLSALTWLTENCGKLYQEITKDENFNADLIDIFAQTFVRHFWMVPIGYSSPLDFFVRLRGFLDENLPIWAQFYKAAIVKQGLYQTTVGTVTVEDNGTLHFEGLNTSNNKSTTTGTNSNNAKNSTTTEVKGSTDQTTNSSNLSAEADSPQDQLNLSINEKGGKGDYDFSYASKVNGGLDQSKTQGENKSNTTVEGLSGSEGKNSTDQEGHNSGQESHDQQTGNFNKQILRQRTQALSELAESISRLYDGAYQNIFHKAKQAGLFLLTY